jgi:thioredoxin 1
MIKANFLQNEQELDSYLAIESLVIVYCTATWYAPCQLVTPLIDRLADEFFGSAKVVKFDIDEHQHIAARLGIRIIPTLIFFNEGKVVNTMVGVKSYEEFSNTLNKILL